MWVREFQQGALSYVSFSEQLCNRLVILINREQTATHVSEQQYPISRNNVICFCACHMHV